MHSWLSSLKFRLILAFAVVLALALSGVSMFIGFAAQRATERYSRGLEEARAQRVEQFLSTFSEDGQPPRDFQSALEQAGALSGRRIVVTDENGEVIGDSQQRFGRPYRRGAYDPGLRRIRLDNQRVGDLAIGPNDAPEIVSEPPATRVASALNRSLIWSGIFAGIGGIILVSFVSQRVLGPIQNLSNTAHQLGQGDLSQRAAVKGPSEIQELAGTFNAMAENLQAAEQQRRIMVADIAHELRTPVSNIQGYVEALKDGLLDSQDGLETIHKQTLHLSNLIDDLRLLSMAEAGNLRLNLESQPMEDLLRDSVRAVRPRAETKGVSVALEAPDVPTVISIDRTRISQVVGNLLDNAIFHTPEGGSITVSSIKEGNNLKVTVADTGEGIPDDVLPMVFERFYRVDPSRARTTGGSGLGLTIAKHLIETHGGTIRAESSPGEGSRFIFELSIGEENA